MHLALGVDGGNTKTIALLATAEGEIVGCGRAGCSDIFNAPSEAAALAELDKAVAAALGGRSPAEIGASCFCLAGADWPEDHELLSYALTARGYGRLVTVSNDAIGALRAGTPDGVGVIVTCGTGVATGARNAAGETWHSGFWQEPMGGQEIGRLALWAVFRAELGIEPPTALTAPFLAQTGSATVEALLRRLFHRTDALSTVEVSRLTPLVLGAAAAGDAAARAIVRDHGRRLAQYAVVAAARVGLDLATAPVVLAGGVFRHESSELVEALAAALPAGTTLVRAPHEPASGALLLALERLGVAITPRVAARLRGTGPPSAFFATL